MSIIKTGFSAVGKLLIVIALAGTFLVGLVGVVYLSLQGEAVKVPEITGKDFTESEKELSALGLKIKKRADRYSTEKVNTVLEQLPKAGDTVKTGQMILVVTSKTNPEGAEEPTDLKKINEEEKDDTKKIEDMISDAPKKTVKPNTNAVKKKPDTKRDVVANSSSGNSSGNSNSSGDGKDASNKSVKTMTTPIVVNKSVTSATPKPAAAAKTPNGGGDVRPRTTPKP